ncbi:MAG: dethiobiotin synthase [Myxococcota bacterium]
MSAARRSRPVADKGVFVVGTDTGVGKTLVAAALARTLHRRGVRVGVFKPFLTGDPHCNDSQVLARAAGMAGPGPLQPALLDVVTPYRFDEPAAPGIAARREGRDVDLRSVLDDARALGNANEVLIVEGAGGLMVPLTPALTSGQCVVDLVAMTGLPALLVGRTALGTINHTALSVEALRQRKIPIAGIILSQVEPGSEHEDAEVLEAITSLTGMKPLVTLPYFQGSEAIRVGSAARILGTRKVWETMLPA